MDIEWTLEADTGPALAESHGPELHGLELFGRRIEIVGVEAVEDAHIERTLEVDTGQAFAENLGVELLGQHIGIALMESTKDPGVVW